MSQNRISIGIKIPLSKATSISSTALKVQNYSYFASDEVGLGYISHVYLGRNDHNNGIVGIKVMDVSKEDDLGQQIIQQEINILQFIKNHHPKHLLLLHEHFKIKNHVYIVTEYCEGKDIGKLLRKKKILTEHEAQSIMKQLMKAYKQLTQMKIIHRDLKLSNILVQKGQLKLADFGFSIRLQKYQQQNSSYNVGSPFYMPPQALKHNKYSFKSDIWALGVMAYEMVYGKLPWRQKVQSVLYDKILSTNIEDLFDGSIVVSENYKAFIRSCLQVHIQRRASPQYVISYNWPLAYDFIEGLANEPNSRPMAMLQQLGSVTTRKIASQNFIHESSNCSNHNSFTKIQPLREKSPNLLNRQAQQNKQLVSSITNLRQTMDRTFSVYAKQFDSITKIILSQVFYCKFIKKTQQKLTNCSYSELASLKNSMNCYYHNKLRQLYKLQKGFQSIFDQLSHLKQYKQSQRWLKVKQLIYLLTEYFNANDTKKDSINYEQTIARAIRQMKRNIQRNYVYLQELTYLYQLKKLENHNNLTHFAANSKIHLLYDQSSQHTPQNDKQELCERLNYRLNLLDL